MGNQSSKGTYDKRLKQGKTAFGKDYFKELLIDKIITETEEWIFDREKENKLFKCKSLNEFLTMFFGYGINEQLSIFDESMTIKAGMPLYRARKDDGKTNLFDSK